MSTGVSWAALENGVTRITIIIIMAISRVNILKKRVVTTDQYTGFSDFSVADVYVALSVQVEVAVAVTVTG